MDKQTLVQLEKAGIIKVYGASGVAASIEIAVQAPELVEVRAMSGKVYDLARNGDAFALVPREEAQDA